MKTKLVLIQVTQNDIDNGVPGDFDRCPIALACNRMDEFTEVENVNNDRNIERFQGVKVGKNKICRNNSAVSYRLPYLAKAFVWAFDKKGARGVEPFDFEIDLNQAIVK